MKTFKQIKEQIFAELKEEVGDDGFWTEQEVKDSINDSYLSIAHDVRCFKLERVIQVRAGIRKYKLNENYVLGSLYRVEFNKKPIYPVSSLKLDRYSRTWRNITRTDITHFIPPGDISNTDEIVLYPLPDTDGNVYSLASTSQDSGVLVAVGDDSYEEFVTEDGVVVSLDEDEVGFLQSDGAVQDIFDATNNIRYYAAKYPKRLFRDNEIFLHPITNNPDKIINSGAKAILLEKEGEGKDIAKASYHNKRFKEKKEKIDVPNLRQMHVLSSITDYDRNRYLNLGDNYPAYVKR